MRVELITFTDERMTISAEKLKESAYKHGIDSVFVYQKKYLDNLFIEMALPTINEPKGAGLYIWKAYICWHYMVGMEDGDILIYADAGQTIVSNVQAVINSMDQDIMMFSNGWKHVHWCKSDVIDAINGLTGFMDYYSELPQAQASLIFFKVTPDSRQFVKRWMLYCLIPGFCDDSLSKIPNHPEFQETRWDQSILCCLQIKYGYRLHWFPTLTAYHIKAEYPNDKYPAIVDHHRKRNHEW